MTDNHVSYCLQTAHALKRPCDTNPLGAAFVGIVTGGLSLLFVLYLTRRVRTNSFLLLCYFNLFSFRVAHNITFSCRNHPAEMIS